MALSGRSSLSGSLASITNSLDSLDYGFNDLTLKVDRKALKTMLRGSDPSIESAEDFFIRVSNESGAIISYPHLRRLETLAKKNPEVKIIGNPVQINLARRLILDQLNPNKNRVALKIDVSYTDHSHIIGKGGKRIQSVMDLTETHIHFPDENRTNTLEKSNLVLIAGDSLRKVDEARQMIRQFLPLIVSFELDVNAGNIGLLDSNQSNIQYFQNRYNVMISFKSLNSGLNPNKVIVQIRGNRLHFIELREATRALYQYLNWSSVGFNSTIITINIEIALHNHPFVMGRGNCNIKYISEKTGAIVSFPRADEKLPLLGSQSSTVTIKGKGIESAFMGWLDLIEYLPVILIFEVKPHEINGQVITSLMANQLLKIKICPKMNSQSKNLVIKTHERHSNLLFQARQQILNIEEEPSLAIPPQIVSNPMSQHQDRNTPVANGYNPINPFNSDPEIMRCHQELFQHI